MDGIGRHRALHTLKGSCFQKHQKRKVLRKGLPTIKITNEAPTKVFRLSRASQLPYSDKHIFDIFIYIYSPNSACARGVITYFLCN